jgi:hypothetical protein
MRDRYSAFSSKDIADFVSNLYDKLNHGLDLTFEEEDFLVELPDNFLEEVDELKQFQRPVEKEPIKPAVKRIKKKKPAQKKLTTEETDELLESSPEMTVLNQFFPDKVFDDAHFNEPIEAHMDASINTFIYLREFGYTTAMWVLGPEHVATSCHPTEWSMGYPICDYLSSAQLTLDNIIQSAQEHADAHSYFPPKAIIALSHPACRCHLVCFPPASPEDIPNTAPGLPTFGEPEEILQYKQRIFPGLQEFPVDRWTVLSPLIYAQAAQSDALIVDEADVQQKTPYATSKKKKKSSFEEERFVFAGSAWVDDIQPIRISKSYLFKSSMGPMRPIPNTYVGFQLSVTDTYARVFLGDLSRTILAPRECVEIANLQPVSLSEIDVNSFIRIDDSFGLVIRALDDGKAQCYLPDFDEVASVRPEVAFKVV